MRRRSIPCSEQELWLRAKALQGASVAQLAQALDAQLPDPRRAKGFMGQLVEAALGADPRARDRPDFCALGIELKTIPVNAQGVPVESTFCCAIDMARADRQLWEQARLYHKLRHVLWIPLTAAKLAPLPERCIGRPTMWRPTAAQDALLRADWEDLMGSIGAGMGTQLTAYRGQVLQVRPKAAHSSVRTLGCGPDGPQRLLPLGFYLRPSFTRQIVADT